MVFSKTEHRPAFDGASFDKEGYCLNHDTCQIVNPVKIDGRLAYEEIRRNCPKCISDKNKSKRGTSLGGGKVRGGRHLHGSSKERSSSSSRPRKEYEYDGPFDEKGRCHHHKNVQIAAKKMSGGWKILHKSCPKCMEQKHYDTDGDSHSVRSGSSRRSAGSRRSTRSGAAEHAQGQFDRNGCCVLHNHIQVAKKKVLGGWKVRCRKLFLIFMPKK